MAAALITTNGAVGARRMAVDGARGELLAAAGRSDDQDAAVGRRDLLDGLAQLIGDRRAADQRRGERRELLELAHLALESRVLQRPVGDQQQPVGLERLLDEVVGAALDRGDRGFDIAVTGNHHDRQFGMLLLEAVEQLQAVEPAALQPDVEEDQIGPARDDGAERLVAVARGAGAVALVLQDARDQIADIRFVVDDQDIGCHDLTVARIYIGYSAAVRGSTAGCGGRKRLRDEAQLHPGAARARNLLGRVAQLEAAAMFFENAADDGEAEAGALLARRHIGLEQARAVFLRQADAVVDHVDDDCPCRRAARCTTMRPRPSSAGGTAPIASVAFLMMLVSACEISRRSKRAGIGFGGEFDLEIDVGMADAQQEHDLTHGLGDVLVGDHGLRHAGKARELVDHALDVVDLAHDGVGALLEYGRILGDRLAVFAAQPLGRQLDRGERVLDLVGDAPRDVGPGRGSAAPAPAR